MTAPVFHANDGYMQKIQILLPEPVLRRLRRISERVDRPVSELIRRATEQWLEKLPPDEFSPEGQRVPVFSGGKVMVSAEEMKEAIYARE